MNTDSERFDQRVAPVIDGALAESHSDGVVDVINPSTGRHCVSIPVGADADVDRAVAAASRAFEEARWTDTPPSVRKKVLHRFADLIDAHSAALDALDAEEMGKPVRQAFANAAAAAGLMRFHAEAIDKIYGDAYGSGKTSFVVQRFVPRGVVGAVVPWNFPTYNSVLKIAPALAAGNCVVLKPSELASRSAVRLALLALEAGVPPGVLNLVPGLGETVGRALGLHHGVDMLTFTGSVEVGKLMLQYSGQSNMKVVVAECGGKSPHVVFGDGVDLDAVCDAIARMLLTNQGQICSVGSRLLVQRKIVEPVLSRIAERMRRIVIGNALDPATTFGPLASAKQRDRVMKYIEVAQSEGASLVTGGRGALEHTGGYFVEPTVFANVSPQARIAQEEIFGPVLSVIEFDDEAQAIRIANGTMYGLAAYVWSASLATGMRVAKAIRSSVSVSAAGAASEGAGYASAHEPAGQSGIGIEGGLRGIQSYLRHQVVSINHG